MRRTHAATVRWPGEVVAQLVEVSLPISTNEDVSTLAVLISTFDRTSLAGVVVRIFFDKSDAQWIELDDIVVKMVRDGVPIAKVDWSHRGEVESFVKKLFSVRRR